MANLQTYKPTAKIQVFAGNKFASDSDLFSVCTMQQH